MRVTMRGMAAPAAAAVLLAGLWGTAAAQELPPITEVTDASPERVEFVCEGVKGKVALDLRKNLDEDFYIQDASADVAIPITCATAPVGLTTDQATISCNKSVSGTETMDTVDGRDLADALAQALGVPACRRTR